MAVSLPDRVFHLLLGGSILLMGGGGVLWGWQRLMGCICGGHVHSRRRGRIASRGMARATNPDEIQNSPLSIRSCIAYDCLILESRSGVKGIASPATLYRLCRGQWNLSIQTTRDQLPIRRCELDLERPHALDRQNLLHSFIHARSDNLLAERGIDPELAGMRRSLSVLEFIVCDGDAVSVFGRMNPESRKIEDAIVTDNPRSRFLLESALAVIMSAWGMWIGLAVVAHGLR